MNNKKHNSLIQGTKKEKKTTNVNVNILTNGKNNIKITITEIVCLFTPSSFNFSGYWFRLFIKETPL